MAVEIDVQDLRRKVQEMYREVAQNPKGSFHFEMGRSLAEKLGYSPGDLDRIPAESIESFAGVGYHFDLAEIQEGERVLDLGSGSGMDAFIAALYVGSSGTVVGLDMTDAQLEKADALRRRAGFANLRFTKGLIEDMPFEPGGFDVVISNGVINLCADKARVFQQVGRVLKPGGRMAISDIVTEKQLTENIVCNTTIWASCIGGAMQQDDYRAAIEGGGLKLLTVQPNPTYEFLSKSARGASKDFGVKSVSLLAQRAP